MAIAPKQGQDNWGIISLLYIRLSLLGFTYLLYSLPLVRSPVLKRWRLLNKSGRSAIAIIF
ncbi:MAG: hypothetical protein V7K97_21045 [Nostoc sp.]|uniref:hypothetical protein n=1 Tax=Nostoc sp. TaxID=1180 RepID=UPI002FF50D07